MSENVVVLRDCRDADGSRRLTASLQVGGNLLIEGVDSGPGVERIFGSHEYEWIWTIQAADVPTLQAALDAGFGLLDALRHRFGGDAAAGLGAFLEDNHVPYRVWSRVGD